MHELEPKEVEYVPDYEARRPGIMAIMKELRIKHPYWSNLSIVAAAKAEWHRRNNK